MTREARLKRRYAALYHCIPPGVWRPAAEMVDKVQACSLVLAGGHRPALAGRVLVEEHFDFRGGSSREEPCLTRAAEW